MLGPDAHPSQREGGEGKEMVSETPPFEIVLDGDSSPTQVSEPAVGTPSTVMQVLKQRSARALLPKRKRTDPRQRNLFEDRKLHRAFWQARFYDFNVWTTKKRVEKLRYIHRNPAKRGLVESPEQWRWSSYRYYLLEEAGPVRVNQGWTEISFRDRAA